MVKEDRKNLNNVLDLMDVNDQGGTRNEAANAQYRRKISIKYIFLVILIFISSFIIYKILN